MSAETWTFASQAAQVELIDDVGVYVSMEAGSVVGYQP